MIKGLGINKSGSTKQKVITSTLQNDIAVVRMSGNFSSGIEQNKNLSNNTLSNTGKDNPGEKYAIPSSRKSAESPTLSHISKSSDSAKNTFVTGSYTSRTNPFNKEQFLSDDDFNDDDSISHSNGSEFTSTSDGSGDVSLAELGLTEDYFSHPEGLFGMSSIEELEMAIDNCKKMILDLPEKSERRKKFVKKLVELRMKLQELKEGPDEIEPKMKQVLSHKLRKKNSSSMKYYCDCCNNLIWGMLQVWYRCRECGFNCHSKCVNLIRRECVALGMNNYILRISPEVGLSTQQFHCAECKNPISIAGVGKEDARICDYNGQYFCPQCHWNDTIVIPARVLHNWDFSKRNVSRRSYQLLTRISRRPLLNVQEINPMLFNYVEELSDIRKLREDIILMKAYFMTCSTAREMKLLRKLKDRQHFVDGPQVYSLSDLIQAQDGTLSENLFQIHAFFAKHIKLDCVSCQAKGFICEICNSGETLFPFDFGVATCTKCHAVFHRDCFTCIDTLCPRCERKLKKKLQKTAPDVTPSDSDNESNYIMDNFDVDPDEHNPTEQTADLQENAERAQEHAIRNNSKSDPEPVAIQNVVKGKKITSEPVAMPQKPELSSLHMLLTDVSYKDYAVLGFAGAGRGRKKSVKSSNGFNNGHQISQVEDSDISLNVQHVSIADNIQNGMNKTSKYEFERPNGTKATNFTKGKKEGVTRKSKRQTKTVINSSGNPFEKDNYNEDLNPFSIN